MRMKRLPQRMRQATRKEFLIALAGGLSTAGAAQPGVAQRGDGSPQADTALQPAHVIRSPWPRHVPPTTRQGVPGIERTAKARLWAVYGRDVESTRNYQVLRTSDDDGRSWSDVKLMILPRKGVRAMSSSIWIDPEGRMWIFWGQSFGQQDGRYGVWNIVTDDPESDLHAVSESGEEDQ